MKTPRAQTVLVLIVLGVGLLVAAILQVGNTIRMAAYAREVTH